MNNEPAIYLSPLKLIYSAYTDEKPCYSAAMEKGQKQIAFYAGIQSGVSLMEELVKI